MYLKLSKEEAWEGAPPAMANGEGGWVKVEEVEIWISRNNILCKTYYQKPNAVRRSSFTFPVRSDWFDRLRPAIRSFVQSESLR